VPVFKNLTNAVPDEWRARRVFNGDDGETTTGLIKPVEHDEDILREVGYNPDEIEIVGNIMQWQKQQPDGTWRVSYRFSHRPKTASLNLPALFAAAARKPKSKLTPASSGRTTIAVLSDVQAGKVGARGGTPELIGRLAEKQEKLASVLSRRKPESVVLLDGGDGFENFESGGNPMFTNDLSLAEQMDLYGTIVYEFVKIASRHGHVDVACPPSNHTAWRRGKQELGRPGDDLGIFVHKQVQKIAEAAGVDASWTFPPMYDEALTVSVRDTVVGLVHGNQFPSNGAVNWWAKQQHGGQPVGAADVLVTAHYHHLAILPTGRNPYTGRTKWWLQAPTLDNGSDWFRNKAGDDSDPGMLVFDVTDDGFDLTSLTVL
jgi:hypothetical protein